jgi:hypothetical protein
MRRVYRDHCDNKSLWKFGVDQKAIKKRPPRDEIPV